MARFCVGDIEQLLFAAFPAADAQDGDRIGLLVGERASIVTRIAIALDATVPTVEQAAALGCNVLVTHHPAFWFAPTSFLSERSCASADGATVYAAARAGVALINMHTNLDCAPSAADMLLAPVGLEYLAPLQPSNKTASGALPSDKGSPSRTEPRGDADSESSQRAASPVCPVVSLGQIARPANGQAHISLETLAGNYKAAFGQVAKVWGDPARPLFKVAVCSGGAGEVVAEVIASGVDCFVTGEVRHHEALYLMDAGITLIELGHDTSELPYRYKLQEALTQAGFANTDLSILKPTATWWQPH
ncbi:MAG: Nif3-like dinuclear metal center hexameric protein [Coriobacteriales bacterium]|jgi:dinuclear metal center YbgI/SA1388 family protein|nr:Nif3-like dinuclear metal center hexameric protein [Coriobacteriales bacterium]